MKRNRITYWRHLAINRAGQLCGLLRGRPLEALHGQKVLVVAPHPDDEALGCGGLMSSLIAAGNHPTLILLTQGEHCHPEHLIPSDEQARVRSALALEANRLLGMDPANIHWLRFVDSRISPDSPEKERLRELIVSLSPDVIFLPYEHDTSPEHQRANRIVREVTEGMSVRLYAYLVWFWQNTRLRNMLHAPWSTAHYLPMSPRIRAQKERMIAVYAEAKNPEGIPYSGPLPQAMVSAQLSGHEFFFAVSEP